VATRATPRLLVLAEAGVGAAGRSGGRVVAAGAGWGWLRDEAGRPVHLTGERGPRGPLTAIVAARMPLLRPGELVALDGTEARPWRTPAPLAPAPADQRRAACEAVRAHVWNDPWATALGREPLDALLPRLAGRGPGLTPAGDDALLGFVLARRALDPSGARGVAARVLAEIRRRSGEPSRTLLRLAAHGEAPEPAALVRDALLTADGPALAPAVRRLVAYGRTTGRAILAGLVGGLGAA
jgi:hypothetical protein